MKVQLVTINTWKCDGDYYKRRQVLADQLKQLTPHIIACQECFLSQDETIDTLRFLAEEMDMYYHFTPARLKPRLLGDDEVMSYSGLGVLSTFSLQVVNEFDLPGCDADTGRKAQQLALAITEEKTLLLTNVHLTHLPDAAILRKQQLEVIAQQTANKTYTYNIVCGDFNAEPNSDEVKFFMAQTNAHNCYELGNGNAPGISIYNGDGLGKTIDHIFALPSPGYPTFTNSQVVLNKPDNSGLYPSDHFGISTSFITI